MPYAPETRPLGQPSAKPVARELIADLMAYPGCYEDKDILDWVCRKTGRGGPSWEYPTDYLFAWWQAGRIVQSDAGVPLLLEHDDDLNRAGRNAYTTITGRRVPRTAPRPDQIAEVATRLAADEDALAEMLKRFRPC
ncbi:hypothetical protein SAMN04488107_0046 [Geodermatophilus saharensis]|uniref:Uncharacterized protein n=1 Tax=Geodermatophilus saharensis TaxID=1137994 RepID=A0A238ZGJ6_9ACTN|nr:hypothetical protein [Geodermatophilus saharensis]SNR82121.1 hypothetical protein SAMN04488107_0046 [Geodermatophilus saharensis]